jgi:hypothetical protein
MQGYPNVRSAYLFLVIVYIYVALQTHCQLYDCHMCQALRTAEFLEILHYNYSSLTQCARSLYYYIRDYLLERDLRNLVHSLFIKGANNGSYL